MPRWKSRKVEGYLGLDDIGEAISPTLDACLQTNFFLDEKYKPCFGQVPEVVLLWHEVKHIP